MSHNSPENPKIAWWRPEPFGAWIRLSDSHLVAINHNLRRRLKLNPAQSHPLRTLPLEAHIAVTQRCSLSCPDCYQFSSPNGEQPAFDILANRFQKAKELGVSTIAFGGGEPLSRDDLSELASFARSLSLVPVLTTNGIELNDKSIHELQAFTQVNVSHDGTSGGYEARRLFNGARIAEESIRRLADSGIPVGINFVLTPDNLSVLLETARLAQSLGAKEIQILRWKPNSKTSLNQRSQFGSYRAIAEQLSNTVLSLAKSAAISVRIDCSLIPIIFGASHDSPGLRESLRQLGVFGCEAARHLVSFRLDGSLSPCSFWPETVATTESIQDDWQSNSLFEKIRTFHANLPEPCASCQIKEICRGGCQVVSMLKAGTLAPDPECPRVSP